MRILLLLLIGILMLETGCGSAGNSQKSQSVHINPITQEEVKALQTGPTEPQPADIRSKPSDPKILYSKNSDKKITPKDLQLDKNSVRVAIKLNEGASSEDNKIYYLELTTKLINLQSQPTLVLRGNIDAQGEFKLFPEENLQTYNVVGFGRCFSLEDPSPNARCTSLYVDIVLKDIKAQKEEEAYYYAQIHVEKITYAEKEKIKPVEEEKPQEPVTPDDDDSENCSNPLFKNSRLCGPPGRVTGKRIFIEDIVQIVPEKPAAPLQLPKIPVAQPQQPVKPTQPRQQQQQQTRPQPPVQEPLPAPAPKPALPSIKVQVPEKSNTSQMQSFGHYTNGRLQNANAIDPHSEYFVKNNAQRKADYGTSNLVGLVNTFAQEYLLVYPEQKSVVSNLSKEKGGKVAADQSSHENGNDVDVGYPTDYKDPTLFVSVVPGLGSPGKPKGKLKVKEFWELMKWVVHNSNVVRIYVHPAIKASTCKYAKSVNEYDKEKIVLTKLDPEPQHFNHFHVRLECPETDEFCMKDDDPPTQPGC